MANYNMVSMILNEANGRPSNLTFLFFPTLAFLTGRAGCFVERSNLGVELEPGSRDMLFICVEFSTRGRTKDMALPVNRYAIPERGAFRWEAIRRLPTIPRFL